MGNAADPRPLKPICRTAYAERQNCLAAEALRAWQGQQTQPRCRLGRRLRGLAQSGRPPGGEPQAGAVGRHQPILPGWNRAAVWLCQRCQKLMKPALVAHGGFKPDDVTVLTNCRAAWRRLGKVQRLPKSANYLDAVVVCGGHSIRASHQCTGKSYVNDVYLILHDTNDKSGHLTEGHGPMSYINSCRISGQARDPDP